MHETPLHCDDLKSIATHCTALRSISLSISIESLERFNSLANLLAINHQTLQSILLTIIRDANLQSPSAFDLVFGMTFPVLQHLTLISDCDDITWLRSLSSFLQRNSSILTYDVCSPGMEGGLRRDGNGFHWKQIRLQHSELVDVFNILSLWPHQFLPWNLLSSTFLKRRS